MRTYIFNIPDLSGIKIGDKIIFKGIEHELVYDKEEKCEKCSLSTHCGGNNNANIIFCNSLSNCIFK